MGPVAAEVTRFFARRGADASRAADEALDGERYLALLDAIDALLADPPLTPAAGTPARVLLPTAVAKAVKRADRALREADARPPGPERDEHLHEMRKAAKRLRYAAEASARCGLGGRSGWSSRSRRSRTCSVSTRTPSSRAD